MNKMYTIIFDKIKINIFILIAILLGLSVFVFSCLIFLCEHEYKGSEIQDFRDALYFSIVTITSVGFGDIHPFSQWGRVVTSLMSLTGVILVALISVPVGDWYKQSVKTYVEKKCLNDNCNLSDHETDAKFCKICGTKLKDEKG